MFKRMTVLSLLIAFLMMSTAAFAENVYVTGKGKKYHKAECRLIQNKEKKEMDLQKAIQAGYEACKKCFKEEKKEEKNKK
ncbi:MAG TPA: hypothetical protein PLH56_06670 [Candidatus Omnitrophota bacterium]|nr:hypothetical protein [Candidatus Omnitrophota bacterium]